MTTALYRRYRPDTFQDVIGQEHVTAPLMAALRADRVTHAYLFSGPRGCGKTTSARILARCLNCAQAPTDTPCGTCPSCQDLATGGPGSLDVVEIDAASHNGVDDARDLRERAAFAPARDRYKIFILDEAHMVTAQGFNALLKLVEEPPAHVKFIFATTEPEKVIGTIRSRTHHYPFRLVPPDILEGYLGQLCRAEGVEVGPGVFPLVVRAGGGSVRDTLSVMDQLIGGAVEGSVDYQRAVALLGYTDTTMLDQCVDAIAAADGAGVFRVVDRVVTSGHDPRRFVEDLLQRLRDLLVIALAGSQAGPALGSLPADELSRMDLQARTLGAATLSRAADTTAQALTAMVGATSPRLQLELLVARLLVPAAGGRPAAGSTAPAVAVGSPGGPGAPASPQGGGPMSGAGAPGATGIQQAPEAAPLSGRQLAAQAARQASQAAAPPAGAPQAGSPAPSAAAAPDPTTPAGGALAGGGAAGQEPPAAGSPQDWPAAPAGSPDPAPEPAGRPSRGAQGHHSGDDGWGGQDSGAGAQSAGRTAPADRAQAPAAPQAGGQVADPGAAEAEMIRTRWEEVLEAAKRSRRATWALVGPNSRPGTLSQGVFTLLFSAPGLVGAFENGGHGPIFSAAIHQALGLRVEVHAILSGDDGPPGGGGGAPGGGGGAPGDGRGPGGAGGAGPRGSSGSDGGFDGPGGAGVPGAVGGWEADSGPGPSAGGWNAGPVGPQGQAVRGGDVAGPGASAVTAPNGPAQAPEHSPPWDQAEPQDWDAPPAGQEQQGAVDDALEHAAESPGEPAPTEPAGPAEEAAPEVGPAAQAAPDWSETPDRPAPAAVSEAPPSDDGWGPVAIPGGAAAAQETAGQAGPEIPQYTTPQPRTSTEPTPTGASPQTTDDDGWGPVAIPGGEAAPEAAEPAPEAAKEPEAPLATVHRLRALPPTPDRTASASPASPASPAGAPEAVSPTAWEASDTFSDGIPLPEEPGDPDGPAPVDGATWTPSGIAGSKLAAAMAAARAAAQDEDVSLAEDTPSEDDEDAEDAGVVGLEVVKRILGATVIEEITVTQEGR